MNKIAIAVIIFAVTAVTGFVSAQAPATVASGAAATQAMPDRDVKLRLAQMNEHLKTMRAQHAGMMDAKTPAERQRWMEDQHHAMQEGMATMTRMIEDSRLAEEARGRQESSADGEGPLQMLQRGFETLQLMTEMTMEELGILRGANGPTQRK